MILDSKITNIETICMAEAAYNYFMTGMNRAIPVAIAVYRYCLVFHAYFFVSTRRKKALEVLLTTYLIGKLFKAFKFKRS